MASACLLPGRESGAWPGEVEAAFPADAQQGSYAITRTRCHPRSWKPDLVRLWLTRPSGIESRPVFRLVRDIKCMPTAWARHSVSQLLMHRRSAAALSVGTSHLGCGPDAGDYRPTQ
jgi:hypothetical protein